MDKLICANAIQKEDEYLKPIICKLTNKRCCNGACRHNAEGFKMMSWATYCPCYKEHINI